MGVKSMGVAYPWGWPFTKEGSIFMGVVYS